MGFNFICQVRLSFDFKDHSELFLQPCAICGESFHLNYIAKEKGQRAEENNREISFKIIFRQIFYGVNRF